MSRFRPGDLVLTASEPFGKPGKWWKLIHRMSDLNPIRRDGFQLNVFRPDQWRVGAGGILLEREIIARVRQSPATAASSSSDV